MSEVPDVLKLGGLEVEIPDAAQQLGNLALGHTTLAQAGDNVRIPPLALNRETDVPLGETVFTLGGTARLEIAIFNGPADQDPDQILEPVAGRGLSDLSLEVLWTCNTASTRPSGRCRRAKNALDKLAEAIDRGQEPDQVERTFSGIEDVITRPYDHRLLGRVVASLVAARAPGEIMKTLRITPEDGTAILI